MVLDMKNIIWDMDGTLIDSYESIVDEIEIVLSNFKQSYPRDMIREMIQQHSASHFFKYVSDNVGTCYEDMWDCYNSLPVDYSKITLMPNVKETLIELCERGDRNFVYTHRGDSTFDILKLNGIDEYFTEIVSKRNGFKRKPSSEAIDYLVRKYEMDKKDTFYVGDRIIDQECAKASGIGRIYYQSYMGFTLDSNDYDYYIDDIKDLLNLNL